MAETDEGQPGSEGSAEGANVETGGEDPPPTDPDEALDALEGMAFGCSTGDTTDTLLVFEGGGVTFYATDGTLQGSYSAADEAITLSFPDLGLEETTLGLEYGLGRVIGFATPSFACYAVATSVEESSEGVEVYMCPKIEYVPEVGWEENEFSLGPNGDVFRRRWTALLQVPDELYWERSGIYEIQDGVVYMAFGGEHDEERTLTATLDSGGLYISELEPEAGPCVYQ